MNSQQNKHENGQHTKTPKVALVHDYLVERGGAERVVEEISEIFPNAPIYTGIYRAKNFKGTSIQNKKIITSESPSANLLKIFPKHLTFLMPSVFENFNLSEFDIVISSSSSYAKGVLTKPNQLHISYIHTPPRFLYKYSVESTKRNAWYYKPFVLYIDHFLRIWDYLASQRADYIVVNSQNVRKRVKKFYGRDSHVIYPPIKTVGKGLVTKDNLSQPYYLAIGRLSSYKNFDLLIDAFNLLDMNLKIVGSGKEEKRLKRRAGKNISFLGNVSGKTKHTLLSNCIGLLFPVVNEDFGIVLVEAMAHGKPVLVHKSGGPLEIVKEGVSGMYFEDISLEGFIEKLKTFDSLVKKESFDSQKIMEEANRFTNRSFKKEFKNFVFQTWSQHIQKFNNQ